MKSLIGLILGMIFLASPVGAAETRIKDIVDFEGVRDNMLVGYGLVVGLNGTGDSLTNAPFTQQSLYGMLERLGVNVRGIDLKTKNVAAVMVTATLPPFATQGSRIDVNVSALGDAKNLMGGTLLVTPLMGADSEVYAVGQGPVATAAISATGAASSVTRGVPTAGRVSNGAIVEREIPFSLAQMGAMRLSLRNPDFTTASRIADAVNAFTRAGSAQAISPSSVVLTIPTASQAEWVKMITNIEQLSITPDQIAKVIIDESSGVIVMGEKVRISTVAISQGNLTIRITEAPQVSQPQPFSTTGDTEIVDRTTIQIDDQADRKVTVLPDSVSLQDLVRGLNALGVGPRDIISILQAIKAAGAMQADIEVI
ncbi:MAG TPA: flagellar basal body P-ring protein FlgI [Alphaproteobacteria bacterium]|nr:flagellar basal body P-ring protein FlgI [Alphaproteobacteria bacterium]